MNICVKNHIKLKRKLSVFVKGAYDAELLDIIHSFRVSYYHKDTHIWELPLDSFKIILSQYTGEINICGELPQELEDWLELLDTYDTEDLDYTSKTTPFSYQKESFDYAREHPRFILGDEQGLGKTKQSLDIAVSRKHKMKHCIIVCGVNELKYNWLNEIGIHTEEKGFILGTRYRKRTKKAYIGGTKDRLYDLQNLHLKDEFFIITNVETLRNKDIQIELKKLCNNGVIGMAIIDEIHKCKNSTSEQGSAIHCLTSYYKLALSGTPLMNNVIDLYNILKWLEVENHTLGQFKNHYCEMGGFGGYDIIDYKNLDELQYILDKNMLRRRKEEVLDLPPKIYTDEYLEMGTKQTKIYEEVKTALLDNIDKILLAPNPLVELIRARQATAHTSILSSVINESIKFKRVESIVSEVSEGGDKLIIFSNWTAVTDLLFDYLSIYNPALVTSNTNNAEEIEKFKKDPSCKVIIGTIPCLGTGFTLTEANTVVFMDEPWNMATKAQAEDRCHRIGTKGTVNIITLMCKDTIDERIHQLVKDKGELANRVVDANFNFSNADIKYLLS